MFVSQYMATGSNGNGHNGNGNGHKKHIPLPKTRPNLTAGEVAAITAAIILGQATQAQLAEQYKCSPKTIQRISVSIPEREVVRELSDKPKTIDAALSDFLNACTNGAIATIRHLSEPEQLRKHTPAQNLAIFAAASERVLFLASAAERARARLQDQGEQAVLPPAEQCVEDEAGVIAGEVE